jgi:uncharacterized protein (DUF849 family)
MLIKAAINGGRSKAEHPSIPVHCEEQAIAVAECLSLGAGAVHLHVRSPAGDESLDEEDVARTLQAVRIAAPNARVGVTTGAWIVPDPDLRVRMISAWKEVPDFASVNFSEQGALKVAEVLLAKGIEVEAGLSDEDDAQKFVTSGLAARCIRVLLEPQEQDIESARAAVAEIRSTLDVASVKLPRVLHGTEATAWKIMEDALDSGYDIRIGFEDTLRLPDGRVARSNAELIGEAVRLTKLKHHLDSR